MKMRKRLLIKIGALFLATSTLLSSASVMATTPDKITVSNTQYDQYQDLVKIRSDFKTMQTSKDYMSSGKYPYELLGPVVAYAIILRELQSDTSNADPVPTKYIEYLTELVTKANNVKADGDSPAIDGESYATIVKSGIATLLSEYTKIQDKMSALVSTAGNTVDKSELYNYLTANSNHIYNVLNTFVYIRNYEAIYATGNYCLTQDSITKINDTLDSLYEMYSGINQEFGIDSLSSKLNFEKDAKINELVWDSKTENLNPLYLYGLSLTSTFIPFVTDVSRQDTYQYFFENITGDSTSTILKFLQYRKPLYAKVGKTAVTDTLNGELFSGSPITLGQFLEVFKSTDKEVVLTVRKDSLTDLQLQTEVIIEGTQSSSGTKPEDAKEETEEAESTEAVTTDEIQGGPSVNENTLTEVAEVDPYTYTEPVYIAGLVKDGDVSSRGVYTSEEVDYLLRDKHFTRVSNFNFGIMYNIVNSTNLGQKVTNDLNKPLAMDIFGNILSASGIVIVPAIANTTLYDYSISNYKGTFDPANAYKNYFFPENATFKMAYPRIDAFNGSITEVQDTFTNRFTFATNANLLTNTADISNLNYYLKFMDTSDIKKRKRGIVGVFGSKILSTLESIQYPTFPIYPYMIGKGSEEDNGSRKQIINKGSFSSIHSKKLLWQRWDKNQHYVLNVGHVLVSDQSGNYYSTGNVGFSASASQGIYDLTKYYLIMDKATGKYDTANPSHNNTFKASLMKDIALQVRQGSRDVEEMVVGSSLSDLNFKEGDQGWFVSTFASWGESLHFNISRSQYLGSILYTPKLDELPLLDKAMVVVKPVLVVLAVLGLFGLILSWRPFGFITSFPKFVIKALLYFSIIAGIFKVMPSFIALSINMPVVHLYGDTTLQNTLIDLEVKEKNINTSYFKGYSEVNTKQADTYIVVAELDMKQYRNIYEIAKGDTGFISEFGFLSYFNSVTKVALSDTLFLQGNQLCMTLDSVFGSSSIRAYEIPDGNATNTSTFLIPELKQSWYTATELHYFTPYHLITEHLLHVLNTVTNETKGSVFPLDYGSGNYKVTGFLRNYMKSNYYLKTPSERMEVIRGLAEEIATAKEVISSGGTVDMTMDEASSIITKNQEIVTVISGIDLKLRTNQDFLGIMKWSGLHSSARTEAPFGEEVVDDISVENTATGSTQDINAVRSMANTTSASWYTNQYFTKARQYLERIDSKSELEADYVNLLVNGNLSKSLPVKLVGDRLYVAPEALTDGVSGVETGYTTDGSMVIYTPTTVVDITKQGASTGAVKVYSNGAYLGEIASIDDNGTTLVALTNIQATTDSTGASLGSALDADIYYNADYNSVMVFYPEMNYVGPVGICYTKVLKVNDKTRDFMNSLYSISLNVSDENMLKAIALNAVLEFNNQFSTEEYAMYPKTIEMSSINFDVFLKQLLIPDIELSREAYAHSLYNYLATTGGFWSCAISILLEILLVILVIMRDGLLAFHTIMLPTLSVMYYIFSSKWFYKPWLGTLTCFVGVAVVNIVTMLGYLLVDTMTSQGSSEAIWALLIAVITTVLGIVGYGYLWYILFRDIRNLGYLTAKGHFTHQFSNLKGKLHFGKDKSENSVPQSEEGILSSRMDTTTASGTSRLSTIERYQSDVNANGIVSSRLDINQEVTSASSLGKELDSSASSTPVPQATSRFSQINGVDYTSLTTEGAVVTRDNLHKLNTAYGLKHGKDYRMIGNTPFVTNESVISKENLEKSYSVVAPYDKALVKELSHAGTPYDVNKDMIQYVSNTPTGSMVSTTSSTYTDGQLTVPSNALNTVKDYLKSNDIQFTRSGNMLNILNKEMFSEAMQQEVNKISQPIKVTTKQEEDINSSIRMDDYTHIVSPDAMLSDIKAMSNRITKIESRHAKRSASTIHSKKINKLFKPDQEVYTYTLKLGNDDSLNPLISDLHQIASSVESNTSRNKALTLRTTDGLSVVFESEDDYVAFKNKFTSATSDYFVRPTVHKNGDNVTVYTLKGDTVESRSMTKSEFNQSDLSTVNCRELK